MQLAFNLKLLEFQWRTASKQSSLQSCSTRIRLTALSIRMLIVNKTKVTKAGDVLSSGTFQSLPVNGARFCSISRSWWLESCLKDLTSTKIFLSMSKGPTIGIREAGLISSGKQMGVQTIMKPLAIGGLAQSRETTPMGASKRQTRGGLERSMPYQKCFKVFGTTTQRTIFAASVQNTPTETWLELKWTQNLSNLTVPMVWLFVLKTKISEGVQLVQSHKTNAQSQTFRSLTKTQLRPYYLMRGTSANWRFKIVRERSFILPLLKVQMKGQMPHYSSSN